MNKSVINMATLRCDNEIFAQMKYFKRVSNGPKTIIFMCFFSALKNYPFRLLC